MQSPISGNPSYLATVLASRPTGDKEIEAVELPKEKRKSDSVNLTSLYIIHTAYLLLHKLWLTRSQGTPLGFVQREEDT